MSALTESRTEALSQTWPDALELDEVGMQQAVESLLDRSAPRGPAKAPTRAREPACRNPRQRRAHVRLIALVQPRPLRSSIDIGILERLGSVCRWQSLKEGRDVTPSLAAGHTRRGSGDARLGGGCARGRSQGRAHRSCPEPPRTRSRQVDVHVWYPADPQGFSTTASQGRLHVRAARQESCIPIFWDSAVVDGPRPRSPVRARRSIPAAGRIRGDRVLPPPDGTTRSTTRGRSSGSRPPASSWPPLGAHEQHAGRPPDRLHQRAGHSERVSRAIALFRCSTCNDTRPLPSPFAAPGRASR